MPEQSTSQPEAHDDQDREASRAPETGIETDADPAAEQRQALQLRTDRVGNALGALAQEFRSAGQGFEAGQVDLSSSSLGRQVTAAESPDGSVAQVLPMQLDAGSGGKDESKWGTLAGKLGLRAERGYQLDALIRDPDVPTLPDRAGSAAEVYGGQPYRQGDHLYIPAEDQGIVATVSLPRERQAGAHGVEVGIRVSTAREGFPALPQSIIDQGHRIDEARHHEALRPDQD